MRTDITFLLDRSGSMHGLADDTIGGFNSLIAEQKKVEGEAVITLCQFDNEFQTDYEGVPIVEANELDRTTYVPRGSTALLDAVARTIAITKERLAKSPADNVLFIIVTDGKENASHEVSKEQVKKLVNELQGKCSSYGSTNSGWEFIFTGANIDSFDEAGSLGISGQNTLNYQATSTGTKALYSTVSQSITRSRGGEAAAFTDKERSENS